MMFGFWLTVISAAFSTIFEVIFLKVRSPAAVGPFASQSVKRQSEEQS
jgi:hypothetical protein